GIGIGRIDEAGYLRMTVGKVDLEIAPTLCDTGVNANIPGVMAIIIEKRLAFVDTVLPLGNDRAHLPLRAIKQSRNSRMRGSGTELREHLFQPPLTDAGRADHGREITAEVARMANVEDDHLIHILSSLPLLKEHQRGDADPLLEDLGGACIVCTVRCPTDIALV